MDPINTSEPVCFDKNSLRITKALQRADILKIRTTQFRSLGATLLTHINEELDKSIATLEKVRAELPDADAKRLFQLNVHIDVAEGRIEDAFRSFTKALEARHQDPGVRRLEAQIDARQREELSKMCFTDVAI